MLNERYLNFALALILITLLHSVRSTSLAQYPQLFQGPRQAGSAIDANIADVCAADVDNDGDLDLIGVYPAGPELAVCLNDGSASFSQPWYVNEKAGTADLLQSVAAGDLNGDGFIDLVSGTWNGFFGIAGDENSVGINLNNGDGTFKKAYMIPVLDKTTEVITGDFDNDNDIDIAATHKDSSSISVLLNNGDATFATFQSYNIGKNAWTLYAAEITGDAFLDMIVARTSGELVILKNKQDGTFSINQMQMETGLQHVHGGDIDGDGDHDLVTVNSTTNKIKILKNRGDGSFIFSNTYESTYWINSVVVADFSGDTRLDFGVANYDSDNITIYQGNGDGSFKNFQNWFIGNNPHDIFAADLNNDGLQEIITCASDLWAIVLLNYGDGTFETIDRLYNINRTPDAIESSDFNGDGFNDIAIYHGYTLRQYPLNLFLTVLFNDGEGYFSNQIQLGGKAVENENSMDLGNGSRHPFSIGDYDQDGDVDIVAGMEGNKGLYLKIFSNDGSGHFERIENKYHLPDYTFNQIQFVESADVDNDSDLDIVVLWGFRAWHGPTGIMIFYNNGAALFDSSYCDTLYTEYSNSDGIDGLTVNDFTGDNYADIAVSIGEAFVTERIILIKNMGNGAFEQPQILTTISNGPSCLFSADFNNDGISDIGTIYGTTALSAVKGQIFFLDEKAS
ncbi:VCBS repeat-containing protein, partial [candidate division KSB1 bacterium]|nr:VCBS repeat-containing protein [candidate division KSB1 bacterium]